MSSMADNRKSKRIRKRTDQPLELGVPEFLGPAGSTACCFFCSKKLRAIDVEACTTCEAFPLCGDCFAEHQPACAVSRWPIVAPRQILKQTGTCRGTRQHKAGDKRGDTCAFCGDGALCPICFPFDAPARQKKLVPPDLPVAFKGEKWRNFCLVCCTLGRCLVFGDAKSEDNQSLCATCRRDDGFLAVSVTGGVRGEGSGIVHLL